MGSAYRAIAAIAMLTTIGVIVLCMAVCDAERPAEPPTSRDATAPVMPADATRFRMVAVRAVSTVDSLAAALGPERFAELLRVNRVDREHASRADSLVVAEPGVREQVFPERFEAADTIPKALIVSLRAQAFAAYDSGRLARSGPTSTGRAATPTPAGRFHANWKSRVRRSTEDSTWILRWAVNFSNRDGLSLHQYDLPGRPASHRCVRLLEEDARWLFDWVSTWTLSANQREVLVHGTPIAIVGAYDFGASPPWRRLPADPAATRITIAETAEAESLLARTP